MFIVPETAPVFRRPISILRDQEGGKVMSARCRLAAATASSWRCYCQHSSGCTGGGGSEPHSVWAAGEAVGYLAGPGDSLAAIE